MTVTPKFITGTLLIGLYIYCLLHLLTIIEYPRVVASPSDIVLHSFYIRTPTRFAYRVSSHIRNNGSHSKILEYHKVVAPPSYRNTKNSTTSWYKVTTDDVVYFTKTSVYPELFWTLNMLGQKNCYLISKILIYTDTYRFAGDIAVVSQICTRKCRNLL